MGVFNVVRPSVDVSLQDVVATRPTNHSSVDTPSATDSASDEESVDESVEDDASFGECGEHALALLAKIRMLESMTANIEVDNRKLMAQLNAEQIAMGAQKRVFESKAQEMRQLEQ